MKFPSLPHRFTHLIYRTARRARRSAFLRYLPTALQKWIDYHHFRTEMQVRETVLVDRQELTRAYRRAVHTLTEKHDPDTLGVYLEFGVYYGTSLALMFEVLQEHGLDQVQLFGFDSFEGLPEGANEEEPFQPGQFSANYRFAREYLTTQDVDWERVTLEKGWFSDTLNDRFIQNHGIKKASLIMVDCDIYSSAKEALDFSAPLIRDETIIFFDDWHAGPAGENIVERRAFREFLEEHPHLEAEEFGSYNYFDKTNAKIFSVVNTRAMSILAGIFQDVSIVGV